MFTILIPTWNNLPYLKCCLDSLLKNSSFQHQIIVHINEGIDGTLDWVKENKIEFTYSEKNIGVCHSLNIASQQATKKYICYFNDDMYALPGWDYYLVKEIETIGHDEFFLSSTMIEPKPGKNTNMLQGFDFGDLSNFDEKRLFQTYQDMNIKDWYGASWPPNVVSKRLWNEVGGYSEEFSPGMYSDPDFSMKLWHQGVRIFKGLGHSKVYHFMSKSTGKVLKNDGRTTFINKWKMTPGFFYREVLKMGIVYKEPLKNNYKGILYYLMKIKVYIKKIVN